MAKKIANLATETNTSTEDIIKFIKSTGEFVTSKNDTVVSIIEKQVLDAIKSGKIKVKEKPKPKKEKPVSKETKEKPALKEEKPSSGQEKVEEKKEEIPETPLTTKTPGTIKVGLKKGNNPYMDRRDFSEFEKSSTKPKKDYKKTDYNNENTTPYKKRTDEKSSSDKDDKNDDIRKNAPFAPQKGGFKRGHYGAKTQGAFGKGKRSKYKHGKQVETTHIEGIEVKKGDGSDILLRKGATLFDFAEKIKTDVAQLVSILFKLGEMVTSTQTLDEHIIETLGLELNYNVKFISSADEDAELLKSMNIALKNVSEREDKYKVPPVITIMGHVDHGKTKLLDAILNENIISTEAGGITQKIGASQIEKTVNGEKRLLTFIDTPGHAAFTSMRKRGAHVTDVAILVVAADDGVMPQTVEAISHARSANVPIVVAINKIDLPGANIQKVTSGLMEHDLVPEEYGGHTIFVQISAKEKKNIDKLLDATILTADADADLMSDPTSNIRGTVIESRKLSGQGIATTILVKNGHLRVGDAVVAGTAHGYIRAIINEFGKNIKVADASQPVRILGLSRAPHAGDIVIRTDDIHDAREIAEKRLHNYRQAQFMRTNKKITLENIDSEIKTGKVDRLNLIIKAEGSGELEALIQAIEDIKIDDGEEVGINIIHKGVGNISSNDVNLAEADDAVIIAFNVATEQKINAESVDIKKYKVLYEVTDDIEKALKGMLAPVEVEVNLGRAEVRQVFKSSKFGNIAGSMVKEGIVKRGAMARIYGLDDNNKEVLLSDNQKIDSLKHFKDDVNEVKEGNECGIGLSDFDKIEEGNIIECFEIEKQARQ